MSLAEHAPVAGVEPSLVEQCDAYLPLVRYEVAAYAARLPRYVDTEELAGSAVLGLVEAATRFDPSKGVPFEAWARQRIRGAILDAARRSDFASRGTRSQARHADAATEQLVQLLGRTPTDAEVAEHLGLTSAELAGLRAKVHAGLVTSLDAAVARFDDDDDTTFADVLVDADLPALEMLERRELDRYVADAVDLLPERQRDLIRDYFYNAIPSSEIAEKLGVTESRVSQLRSEALTLLREAISGQYVDMVESTNRPLASAAPVTSSARGRAMTKSLSTASSYSERLTSTTTTLL